MLCYIEILHIWCADIWGFDFPVMCYKYVGPKVHTKIKKVDLNGTHIYYKKNLSTITHNRMCCTKTPAIINRFPLHKYLNKFSNKSTIKHYHSPIQRRPNWKQRRPGLQCKVAALNTWISSQILIQTHPHSFCKILINTSVYVPPHRPPKKHSKVDPHSGKMPH